RPALGPGATSVWRCITEYVCDVSILARLWGRALLFVIMTSNGCFRFQSSPGFGAGRYRKSSADCHAIDAFQSSPGFGAGRYYVDLHVVTSDARVSILARLWGRALLLEILI